MKLVFTWAPQARSDIANLDRMIAKRVLDALARFGKAGEGDVKTLQGPYAGQMRLRVGDWRIRFRPMGPASFEVLAVENRGQAYR